MLDTSSIFASELLSFFGKNTAVRIDHDYGSPVVYVKSARTGNVISEVMYADGLVIVDELFTCPTIDDAAILIMGKKKFPRNRKMNKAWSPIRFSAASKAMMESDSGIRFS